MEYASDLEKETDIYLREFEIDCNKIYTTFLLESAVDDDFVDESRSIMEAEEGEVKPKSKFMTFITNLAKRIRQVLKDIGEMISNIFSRKREATAEDFRQSEIFTKAEMVRLEELDEEIKASRKVINKISSVTPFSYDQVADFFDSKAKKLRESNGLKVVTAAVSAVAAKAVFDKVTGNGEAAVREAEAKAERIKGDQNAEKALGKALDVIRKCTAEVYKIGAKGARVVTNAGETVFQAGAAASGEANKQAYKRAKKEGL